MKEIIRVFPRKTNATPVDGGVRLGNPGLFDKADEIHISVAFSEDLNKAEELAKQWELIAPVKIGGPATDNYRGEFIPGMYLKKGYVITSRGCPNKCWFCEVWKKFDKVEELEIKDGWNVLDDNLLACSRNHIENVFKMLKGQTQVAFTGGLEAAIFKDWHVDLLLQLKLNRMFFAYDTPDDYEPLVRVSKMLKDAGIIRKKKRKRARCFVLIGYSKDTFRKAEQRLVDVMKLGFMPMSMLYNKSKNSTIEWLKFQSEWASPIIVAYKMIKYY